MIVWIPGIVGEGFSGIVLSAIFPSGSYCRLSRISFEIPLAMGRRISSPTRAWPPIKIEFLSRAYFLQPRLVSTRFSSVDVAAKRHVPANSDQLIYFFMAKRKLPSDENRVTEVFALARVVMVFAAASLCRKLPAKPL
jgi:hypothetical protein